MRVNHLGSTRWARRSVHPSQKNHFIHTAHIRTALLGTNVTKHLAELANIGTSHQSRIALLKQIENAGSCHPHKRLSFLRQSEYLEEDFFFGGLLVEILVMLLNLQLFFLREPVTLASLQFPFQLGIELGIINGRTVNRFLHLHTEETSASRLVGQ